MMKLTPTILLTLGLALTTLPCLALDDAEGAQAQDPEAAANGSFSFLVMDIFTITGKGIVITGQAKSGTVRIGDTLCVSGRKTAVTGIEMFRKELESLSEGQMGGLLLEGIEKNDVEKGAMVVRCAP